MKKLLYLLLFVLLFLSGCEKKTADVAPASLFELDGDSTSAGVSPGDGRAAFIKAYKKYTIQVAYQNLPSDYMIMSISEIPYTNEISTMIANFFINDEPVSEETLCEENDVEPGQLHSLLSSSDYLREHEVLYRYLRFKWEDGVIESIESDALNYNETFETPCIR